MRRRSYGSKALSQTKARTALAQLLAACKPEKLHEFTPERLAGSWNVTEATAAAMLEEAKARRL